ncbi:hypothetical protein SAMN05518871_11551 [Psychrobacillus sp. OK028]|uniref:hypothetical protein n=1 Tax=Psychrobacillus sp. OK028 TaxID=1884359 RepID=UPI0008835A2F|nr:hypothetical protein [Psychrobacillus sp. OK028]SDO32092.1 hypothetical protein SAMN05518871_11551 [Psychrobacillus sp. OK028]
MKKIYSAVLLLLLIVIGTIFYQQHQLIDSYRELLYGQLSVIQKPTERILAFQETAEQYDEEQRDRLLEPLVNAFSDIYNFTGGGLQMEQHIRELYFGEYKDTKGNYADSIHDYEEATTSEEREQAHIRLQEQYEAYEEFLKKAETELVEPFE